MVAGTGTAPDPWQGLVVWADGRLRTPDEPVLSGVDHGFTVGDGVFETCAVHDGVAFALRRHLDRLERSARGLGLDVPDRDLLRRAVAEVLAAAGERVGRLRITVSAGPGPLGSARVPGAQSVVVLAAPAGRAHEARVARVPWVRNERSAVVGLKTTSYAENVLALAHAIERGADEALLANTRGELCEGTGSNVLVERDDEVLTPPLSSGCLAGVTRALLLEWAEQESLPVREAGPGELRFSVLEDVARGRASLGLTSSTRDVVPVVALDGAPVAPGELIATARSMFLRRAAEDVDP